MRIAIVSSMLHPRFGGPPSVVANHFYALARNHEVEVFGCAVPGEEADIAKIFNRPRLFPPAWPQWWMRTPELTKSLIEWRPDVLHCHDVWLYGLYASWRATRSLSIPLVLTPHGIFTASWRYRSMHKRIYRAMVLDRILKDVSAIHVLNKFEAQTAHEAGLPERCVMIPNGIAKSEFAHTDRSLHRRRLELLFPQLIGRRIVLYLGRLWSEKGLDILPACWASAKRMGWVLVIAGPDYREYRSILEREISQQGIANDTVLVGPIIGETKRDFLAGSDIFILPSHGEGFSMSVLEAVAAGTPCILTKPCNFPELAEVGGGWECADDQESVTRVLNSALAMSNDKLMKMGENARKLGLANFTAEIVADRLSDLYSHLINGDVLN